MQEDKVDSFFDLPSIKTEISGVISLLDGLHKEFQKFQTIKIGLGGLQNTRDIINNINQIDQSTKQIVESTNNVSSAHDRLVNIIKSSTTKQIEAYTALKSQYKDAEASARSMAAQYGIQSEQAIKAAQAADQYRQRLEQINSFVKSGGTQPSVPVPFTSNLSELEREREDLKKTGEAVNDLERSEAQAANSATAMGDAFKETATHTQETKANLTGIVGEFDAYTGSLRQNIAAQIENNTALTANKTEQKEIEKAVRLSGEATNEQVQRLSALKEQELLLNDSNKQLNTTIQDQVKSYTAAGGSATELKAKISLLQNTYDGLAQKEKQSAFGSTIDQNLKKLKVDLSEVEQEGKKGGNVFQNLYSNIRQLAYILPGVGIAGIIGALTGPLIEFGSQLFNFSKKEDEVKKHTDEMMKSFQDFSNSVYSTSGKYGEAVKNVDQLTEHVKLAKDGFIDKKEVVDEYNKSMGKATGNVETLDQVEKKLVDDGPAYIQMMYYKAIANAYLEEAVKKAMEAEKNRSKLQSEATYKPVESYSTGIEEDLKKSRQSAQKKLDDQKADQQLSLDYANEYQQKAAEIAKKFHFNFFEDNPTKEKKDYKEELYKQLEAMRKAQFEFQSLQLKDKIDYDRGIIQEDSRSFDERRKAAQDYYESSLSLLQKQRDFELSDVDFKNAEEERRLDRELKNNKLTAQQRKDLEGTLTALKQKGEIERAQVVARYNNEVIKLNDDSEKQNQELYRKYLKQEEKDRKDQLEQEIRDINDLYRNKGKALEQQRISALDALDKQYEEGKIKTSKYENERFSIEQGYALKKIQLDIENQKELLDLADLDEKKKEEIQQKLFDFEKKADDEITKIKMDNMKLLEEARKDLAAKEKELAQESVKLLQTIVDGAYDKQKNAIQDQITLLQQKKEKDTEAVSQSVLNAQDKQAALAVINAKEQAQEAQLNQKQKKIDQDKAKFDKIIQISQITGNALMTEFNLAAKAAEATATANLLAANPLTVGYAPVAAAAAATIGGEIPIVAGIAAAQIAEILATPIPKFFKGKNVDSYDYYEGLAWVGDGGKSEAIIRENGGVEITPNVPTLTYLSSKDIVLPDANMLAMAATKDSFQMLNMYMNASKEDKSVQEIKRVGKSIVNAIANQPETHIVVENKLRKWVRTNGSWKGEV